MSDLSIINKPDLHRYEATLDGTLAAYCEYNLVGDAVMFTHTEVLTEHEGKGYGSALAHHVLDDVRKQGKHVIPVCQFIAGFLRKHREYADLVRPDIAKAFKI